MLKMAVPPGRGTRGQKYFDNTLQSALQQARTYVCRYELVKLLQGYFSAKCQQQQILARGDNKRQLVRLTMYKAL